MSDINSLVLEAVGPIGLLASGAAGLGGAKLHSLLAGAAAAGSPFIGLDPLTGAAIAGGLVSGGLNVAKNFLDPQTRYDYAGNALRGIGAAVSGSLPGAGAFASGYNAAGLGYHTFDRADEYNRHRQLQDWANKTNMIQQARAGNYSTS